MALVRARRPVLSALTAASAAVSVSADKGRLFGTGNGTSAVSGTLAQSWQFDAWAYFDTIGALKYAARFVGNAMSRIKLTAAVIPEDGEDPIPVSAILDPDDDTAPPPGIDLDMCRQAVVEVSRLRASIDGQAGMMRDFGLNLTVAGDCYLVGIPNTDPDVAADETWNVYSVTELRKRGVDRNGVITWGLSNAAQPLPAGTVAYRIYQPHPQRRQLADSPVRGILDDLEELALLNRAIRSTAKSRVAGSGILTVPSELSFEKIDPLDPNSKDVFTRDLMKHMSSTLDNEASAANIVPHIIRGKAEFLDAKYLRHIVLDRPLDTQMVEQRKEKLAAIGIGMDLPAEIVTGLASANHWSAWQVDEATYKSHLEPLSILLCSQIGSTVLRDMLVSQGKWQPTAIARVVVIGDASALVDHPDQSADAFKAHEAFVLSDKALRKYARFTDEDAPDPDEVAQRIEQQRLIHSRGSEPQIIPPGDVAGPITPASTRGNVAPVAPGAPPAAQQAGPGATAAQAPNRTVPPARTASAAPAGSGSGRPVGQRLSDLDMALMNRVHGMVQTAVRRQLERAGAQITSKAQRDRQTAALARKAPKHMVAAHLGRPVVASLGFADTDLSGDYSDVLDQIDAATKRTRRAGLAALLSLSGRTLTDAQRMEYEQAAAQAAEHGRRRLQEALAAFTLRQLYNPDPTADDRGEGVAAGEVPPGVVMSSLALWGGQELDEQGRPTDGGPLRAGLAAGDLNLSIGASLGIVTDIWQWAHGAPQNPFEPHEDLDGQVFGDDPATDSARLANTDDLWLGSSEYYPGDHDGCTCWAIPLLTVDEA